MSLKVGLRLDGEADPAFRLDPEKMLPRATAPGPAAQRPTDDFVTERPPGMSPLRLDVRAEHTRLVLLDAERALILRYCHLLNASQATQLLDAFMAALEESLAERRRRPSPPRLSAGWWREPWYDLEPAAFFGTRRHSDGLGTLNRVLDHARRLGFHNVALIRDLDLVTPLTRPFDALIEHANQLELRIAAGLDASHLSLVDARQTLASALHTPAGLGRLLRSFGAEATHGVRAARAHRVDHWIGAGHGAQSAVHAVLGLLKVFLRLLDPEEVLVPELASWSRAVEPFVGGGVEIDGHPSAAEGDVIFWPEGAYALRQALIGRRGAILDAALGHRPRLLHGAALTVALEDHDEHPSPMLAEGLALALGDDRARVDLALGILYAMPVTPVVHAGLEVAAHYGTLTPEWLDRADLAQGRGVILLEALNRLRTSEPALGEATLDILEGHPPSTLAWRRGPLLFVANLGHAPEVIEIDRAMLDGSAPSPRLVPEDALGRPLARAEGTASSWRLHLEPSAYGYFSL